MIFFDNVNICPSPNYYVQKMFSSNQGDHDFDNVMRKDEKDTLPAASCLRDSKTGDISLKRVNAGAEPKNMKIDQTGFKNIASNAIQTVIAGDADAENTFENLQHVIPVETGIKVGKTFEYDAPAMLLTVIRIKTKK
jgi:alpha-N-arabinofuranosidase